MQFKPINDRYAVAPQIEPGDLAAILAAGYRSVMCNRPDGEEPGQPTFAVIAAAAKAAGLVTRHVPVRSGHITDDDVAAFAAAIAELPAPVFAYCRSGARCTHLWAMLPQRG